MSTSVVITMQEPFENEEEKKSFYEKIEWVLREGYGGISDQKKFGNFIKKKEILIELAEKGLIVFKENGLALSAAYARSVNNVDFINLILKTCRYTKERHEYDIKTGELIQIPPVKA